MKQHYQKISTILLIILVFLAGYLLGGLTTSTSQAQDVQAIGDVEAAFSPLFEAYEIIQDRYVDAGLVDIDTLVDGALDGMVKSLGDPYSSYLNAEAYNSFTNELSGNVEGIGVVIFTNDEGQIEVRQVLPGTGAEAAGVMPGDIFVEVNGESVQGLDQTQLALLVRGPAGTTVDVTFLRGEELVTFTITRSSFEIPNVESEVLEDSNIAYIRLSEFNELSHDNVKDAIAELDVNSRAGLIFDLRDNPGGLLTAAIDIASLFIEDGVILHEDFADGSEQTFESTGDYAGITVPIVVLINENSASASELVSGAMQDNAVAYLIGEVSFGKGTVQTLQPLSNEGAIRITIARYLLPSRRWIHEVGVTPDLIVELDESTFTVGDPDPQLQAAIDYIINGGQQ